MSFLNGVLAPSIAATLLTQPANLSDSPDETRLLRPQLRSTGRVSPQSSALKASAGRWFWNGIELHSSDFKVAYGVGQEQQLVWYAGRIPKPDEVATFMGPSASVHSLHPTQAQSLFSEFLRIGSWEIPLPEPVIRIENQSPQPWWRVEIGKGRRVFWLRETDGFWGEQPELEMQAEAKALLYRENKFASEATGLEEIPLKDLIDVTYLRSRLFRVLNCLGKRPSFSLCGNYARSATGRYEFPFDSAEYSEMSAYYSIQRAVEWHRGIQSEEQKKSFFDFGLTGPIDIFVRADSPNAPAYSPRSSNLNTENPVIYVSTGIEGRNTEPGELANLSKDSDVYFHEFAHHIVYRSVVPQENLSQPRALQEGLADYFAYAMTGNNKLGESIFGGTPLREGNITANLSSDIFALDGQFDPYYIGQILSSVLWDLRSGLGDWKNGYKIIDKIAWDAIDLLPELATLYQFSCAMVKQADIFEKSEQLTPKSLTVPIVQAFASRQFFADANINPAVGCPAVNAILQPVDERESQKSELPIVEKKNPPKFTGAGRAALPPYGGSLYQPLQPRKVVCGSVSADNKNGQWGGFLLLFTLVCPVLLFRPRKNRNIK